ncbi:MAG: PDZ domain-containing protein, partial [Rubrivivax sp.]|nr:PDZ domain-containing protein [Pyrinomonadaceae bacterium]
MKLNRHTRKLFRAAFALCALACILAFARASGAGGSARAESAATREARLRVFDEVWEQVRARYFDPALQGVDWQEARRLWRPRAAEAGTEGELYSALRRMLGLLRDPHTRVFAPGESTDWRVLRYVSVGVSVRELGGEIVVTDVERESDAARAGVRTGDAVLSVDGEPSASLVARRLAEAEAGDSATARLV